VVTTASQASLVKDALPHASIIVEPCARDTAASIAFAAMCIDSVSTEPSKSEAVMVVLPADHAVNDDEALRQTLLRAISVAREQDLLVTIGIPPTCPHTGYGYIKRGRSLSESVFQVARFFEKPSEARATEYIESGDYLWNSGMFAWRISTIRSAMARHMPALDMSMRAVERAPIEERDSITEIIFNGLEPISIDFGLLEHAQNCAVVSASNFGWNDVGSWDAWAALFKPDDNNNLIRGDTVVLESSGCVIHSEKRLTAIIGVEDLVVIDTDDALLICPRNRVQEVKKIVKELERSGRNSLL
jgi:mannose-1-phosphate guanylyltransferase